MVKGRGLFATQDIKCDEIISEEKPIVSSQFLWNEFYGYSSCEYCLKPLETAEENVRRLTNNASIVLPFSEICVTNKLIQCKCDFCHYKYCCLKCKTDSWNQYHRSICTSNPSNDPSLKETLNELINVWKERHYPPETASILLVVKIFAYIKQSNDKKKAIDLFSQFCSKFVNESEQIVHKLLGDEFQNHLNLLRELVTKAMYDSDIPQLFTPEGFLSLIAMIGTNGQGIGTSPLSCWVRNCDKLEIDAQQKSRLDQFIEQLYESLDKEVGTFLNNEGSGLYVLQSVGNHSCAPNAQITFPYNDFTLVLQAVQDIKAGEEVLCSYLDECTQLRSRHSRIKILRQNYLFTCHCLKCESQLDEPDLTSDDDSDQYSSDEHMNCDLESI